MVYLAPLVRYVFTDVYLEFITVPLPGDDLERLYRELRENAIFVVDSKFGRFTESRWQVGDYFLYIFTTEVQMSRVIFAVGVADLEYKRKIVAYNKNLTLGPVEGI